ncbi:MAG: hypothetical protein L0Y66_19850 [Myxococcaceae bacterium]|nr:hypothetical protein [Myxococcaceae bacterium]MCI0672877.1 hypothetical protein [Myxococcaceae bacterium]
MRARNVALLAVLGLAACGPEGDEDHTTVLLVPAPGQARTVVAPARHSALLGAGVAGATAVDGTPALPLDPIPIAPSAPDGTPPGPRPPNPR